MTTRNRSYRTAAARGLVAAGAMLIAACSSPEQKVERYYESGAEFLEKGDLGRANVQFQNVLKIDEEHVPTLLGVAQIAETKNNFEAMFGIYQKIIRLDPENLEAITKLGKLYLIGSEETRALELSEQALALDATNIDARALKAAVLLRAGDRTGAVEIAKGVIADDPGNSEAATVVVTERAMASDFDGALAELNRVLEYNPKVAVLQLMRIRLLSQQNRDEDVLQGYADLAALFPEEATYKRSYAAALIERGDLKSALTQLEGVVALLPNELNAKLDVVRVLRQEQGPDAAEKKLQAYVEAQPDDADLKFALADYYLQHEQETKSEAVLTPLTKSDDADLANRAKNHLAGYFIRSGKIDDARVLVDDILSTDQQNTQALIKKAQFQIADGDFDDAIAGLRTAQNNDPDAYEAMVAMANAFIRQGNRDFARAELTKAFEVSDKRSDVARIFARFLLAEGDASRAEDVLEQALAQSPNDVDNLKLLAQAQISQQDWRGAEEVADLLENLSGNAQDNAALNIRSVALSGLEEHDRVIEMLSSEQSDEPLGASPLAMLTRAYLAQEKYDEARAMLSRVIDNDGDNYVARLLLAQVVEAADEPEALEEVLTGAAEAAPTRPEAYIALFRHHLRNSDRDKAEAAIDTGLSNASNSNALKIYKADLMLSGGDREGALELYEELVGAAVRNKIVVNNYISLTSELRPTPADAQRALAYAELIASEANPNFKDTLGWAYYRAGDYTSAVTYLAQAANALPNNPEVLYHYGAAKVASGDVDGGKATLREAVDKGGADFPYASEATAILND
ncbi:MAG: tetratricopeptide repeat protein [Pseudomonadota bacterium]